MLSPSSHVHSEILIHLNWHCKNDLPLLNPELERELHAWMQGYCESSKGILFLGVGGTEDHVHLLIQMEPYVCLADWVGRIKGSGAYEMNQVFRRKAVQWQRGYGAVSFAGKDLPGLQRYVSNQKEHHRDKTTRAKLEIHDEHMEPQAR